MTQNLLSGRLLRAEEVARMLGIGRSTVYLLAKRRQLPFLVIGHSVRFPENALRQFIDSRTLIPEDSNGQEED